MMHDESLELILCTFYNGPSSIFFKNVFNLDYKIEGLTWPQLHDVD